MNSIIQDNYDNSYKNLNKPYNNSLNNNINNYTNLLATINSGFSDLKLIPQNSDIIDYIIQRLNFRISLIKKSESIVTNIYTLEDFVFNKNEMIKNYSEIEQDIIQGIEGIKTLLRVNKDLQEQIKEYYKASQVWKTKYDVMCGKNEHLDRVLNDQDLRINELAGINVSKDMAIKEYEIIINNVKKENDITIKDNQRLIYENSELRKTIEILQLEMHNIRNSNAQADVCYQQSKDNSNNTVDPASTTEIVNKSYGENISKNISNQGYKGTNKEQKRLNDEELENYNRMIKPILSILKSDQDILTTMEELYGKAFLTNLINYKYSDIDINEINSTLERLLYIINNSNELSSNNINKLQNKKDNLDNILVSNSSYVNSEVSLNNNNNSNNNKTNRITNSAKISSRINTRPSIKELPSHTSSNKVTNNNNQSRINTINSLNSNQFNSRHNFSDNTPISYASFTQSPYFSNKNNNNTESNINQEEIHNSNSHCNMSMNQNQVNRQSQNRNNNNNNNSMINYSNAYSYPSFQNTKQKQFSRGNSKENSEAPVYKGGYQFEKCLREYEKVDNAHKQFKKYAQVLSSEKLQQASLKAMRNKNSKSNEKKFNNFGSKYDKFFSDPINNTSLTNFGITKKERNAIENEMINTNNVLLTYPKVDNNKNIKIEDETDNENENENNNHHYSPTN